MSEEIDEYSFAMVVPLPSWWWWEVERRCAASACPRRVARCVVAAEWWKEAHPSRKRIRDDLHFLKNHIHDLIKRGEYFFSFWWGFNWLIKWILN